MYSLTACAVTSVSCSEFAVRIDLHVGLPLDPYCSHINIEHDIISGTIVTILRQEFLPQQLLPTERWRSKSAFPTCPCDHHPSTTQPILPVWHDWAEENVTDVLLTHQTWNNFSQQAAPSLYIFSFSSCFLCPFVSLSLYLSIYLSI